MATSLINDALLVLRQTAGENEIKTAFSVLSGGLKSQFGADEKSTALAYFYSLDGISSWALQKATKDVLKEKAESLSTTFMPSSADFRLYCEKLERDVRSNCDSVMTSLGMLEEEIKEQGTPVTIERMEEFRKELRGALKSVE
ncbi:hypothetical protein V3565_02260 [Bartonella sp. B10]